MKKFTNFINKLSLNKLRNKAVELCALIAVGAGSLHDRWNNKYILRNISELLMLATLVPCMIEDSINGEYEVDTWNMFCIVICLAYIVSPLDFIPNDIGNKYIPGIGYIDELFALGGALECFKLEMYRYKDYLNNTGKYPEAYEVYTNESYANTMAYQI